MSKQFSKRIEITKVLSYSDLNKYPGSNIDVLIPAHNSEKSIYKVITNLASQTIPKDSHLHITVCANACDDNTPDVARKAMNKINLKNKNITTSLIITKEQGEPSALNRMLKQIDNEIIIKITDDVFPSKHSLARLYVSMKNHPKLGAIGIPSRPLPEYTGNKQVLSIRIANCLRKLYAEKDIVIIGQMCAFRKSVVNHFPTDIMSEDNYLTYQSLIKSSGYGIVKDKRSFVYYKPPFNLEDVFNQTLTHSVSGVQFFREYPNALDMFIKIQEKIESLPNKTDKENQDIDNIAKQIKECCWELAVLLDKYEPYCGSIWKRVPSTL